MAGGEESRKIIFQQEATFEEGLADARVALCPVFNSPASSGKSGSVLISFQRCI